MKSPYLLPAFTALLGFSIAWIAKPAADTVAPVAKSEDLGPNRPAHPETSSHPPRPEKPRSHETKPGNFRLADLADRGPKSRDEAKMLRLTEALGLTIDQQGAIIKLVEDVQATASDKVPVITDLTTRGAAIQDGLAKVLTPEQLAKFQEIRDRERDNRTELRSQRFLTQAIDDIDLTTAQRDELLKRLRQKAKADLQTIPAAASLLFDKSLLPTGNRELSVDGILLLAQLGKETVPTDPMAAHQQVLDHQRQELEEILKCFDGVLTPGQMGQYQAAIAEQRKILSSLPQATVRDAGP